MGNISSYAADGLLNAILTDEAYTLPTDVYLALFTDVIHYTDNIGTPTEVSTSGTGYSRQIVTMGSATDGLSVNTDTVNFSTATDDWGTIVAIAICDLETEGNILFFDNICPVEVSEGDTAQFAEGAVRVSLGITT